MSNREFIEAALNEDVGDGDYSTLSCIAAGAMGKAVLKIKEDGIIAGIGLAEEIFQFLEPACVFTAFKKDGDKIDQSEAGRTGG